jgi:predicted nucleic acid-binding protein
MSVETFSLDTNILVYALDAQAGERHALATRVIDLAMHCDCRLTLQVTSEFYAAVTRKRLVSPIEAAAQAQDWLDMFPTIPACASAARTALAAAAAGQVSYWDALLVATVAEAGCTAILTEDLADGSRLFGVRILNPFAGSALAPEAAALLATG